MSIGQLTLKINGVEYPFAANTAIASVTSTLSETWIEIDPNFRVRGNETWAPFDAVLGRFPVVGDIVRVYESEADVIGRGRVTDIDADRHRVYMSVDWAGIAPRVTISPLVVSRLTSTTTGPAGTMPETKDFTPADIVCALDGKLIVPFERIHSLLDWMTGEPLLTHQLPRAMDECHDHLAAQHPDLAAVVIPEGLDTWDKVNAYAAELAATYGDTRPVSPLPTEDHTRIDPITELRMMRPDMPIIAIPAGDGTEGGKL